MSENTEFEAIAESLKEDPEFAAALRDHNEACEEDEATCVVCQFKKAIGALSYVRHALDHHQCGDEECEDVSEFDIAYAMINDLESALAVISVCQQSIQMLAEISNVAAFIISENELGEHE